MHVQSWIFSTFNWLWGLPQAFIHRKHYSSCLFGLAKGINFTPGYRSGCRLSALHFPQEQRFTTILLRRKSKPSDEKKQKKKRKKSAPARSKFVRNSGEITRDDCGGMFPCFFPNIIYCVLVAYSYTLHHSRLISQWHIQFRHTSTWLSVTVKPGFHITVM